MEDVKQYKSALQLAAEYYIERGSDFWKDFDFHTKCGHVYIDAGAVAMMRPCREEDPFAFCFPKDANAWYVHYIFGDNIMPRLMQITKALAPSITRLGFTRSHNMNDIRFYDIDKFGRKL